MLPKTKGYFITGTVLSLAQEKSRKLWATRVGYFLQKGLLGIDFNLWFAENPRDPIHWPSKMWFQGPVGNMASIHFDI